MDVTDGAAASAPHVFMDGSGSMKRRRPMQSSSELARVVRGGYDATFSHLLPDNKHVCFVCKKVLRQPQQTKCGHRFCASCIRPTMSGSEVVCPEQDCHNILTEGDLFPDTFAEREILNLDVLCAAVAEGCSWSGKLRNMEEHQSECKYMPAVCGQNGCPDLVQRRSLNQHQQELCRYRFQNCDHCSAAIVFHTMPDHQEACQEWPMECPQQCGETMIPRRLVSEHVANGCMFTVSKCRFAFVDCPFTGNHAEMEAHLADSAATHLVQLASVCALQQRQLSDRSREITALQTQLTDVVDHLQRPGTSAATSSSPMKPQSGGLGNIFSRRSAPTSAGPGASSGESSRLQQALERVTELEKQVASLQGGQSRNGVLVWKVDDYTRRRRLAVSGGAKQLTSEPFYTGPHGYKLCARVYLNGDGGGLGNYLSLYVIIMKGEYDMVLRWPFAARVTVSLLDQGQGTHHHHEKFFPDSHSSSFSRPMGEMNVASGCPQFFRLSALEHFGYVQNDCIVFRVSVDTNHIQGVDSSTFA